MSRAAEARPHEQQNWEEEELYQQPTESKRDKRRRDVVERVERLRNITYDNREIIYHDLSERLTKEQEQLLPLDPNTPPSHSEFLVKLHELSVRREALLEVLHAEISGGAENARTQFAVEVERIDEEFEYSHKALKDRLLEACDERVKKLREEKDSLEINLDAFFEPQERTHSTRRVKNGASIFGRGRRSPNNNNNNQNSVNGVNGSSSERNSPAPGGGQGENQRLALSLVSLSMGGGGDWINGGATPNGDNTRSPQTHTNNNTTSINININGNIGAGGDQQQPFGRSVLASSPHVMSINLTSLNQLPLLATLPTGRRKRGGNGGLPGQIGMNIVPGRYEFVNKCLTGLKGCTSDEIGEDLEGMRKRRKRGAGAMAVKRMERLE